MQIAKHCLFVCQYFLTVSKLLVIFENFHRLAKRSLAAALSCSCLSSSSSRRPQASEWPEGDQAAKQKDRLSNIRPATRFYVARQQVYNQLTGTNVISVRQGFGDELYYIVLL